MNIKITNASKRTADLFLLSLAQAKASKSIVQTPAGPVEPERKAILGRKPGWNRGMTPEAMAEAIVKGDPEIDMASVGRPVQVRSTVFLNKKGEPVTQFRVLEDKMLPDGTVKETKPYKATETNVELPVQVQMKGSLAPNDFVSKLVCHKIYQVLHRDSLGFDFMMALCQELGPNFVRLGAGLKGNEPLILRREGLPCFAFLRGMVDGNTYRCTLHLTHTELKAPAVAAPALAA